MAYTIFAIIALYLLMLIPNKRIAFSSGKAINTSISSIVLLIFLILIMGGNNYNPDTPVYNNIYNLGLNYTKNIGFAHIMVFFKSKSWSYEAIRLLLVAIGLLLISYTIHKYVPARYRGFTYILYFIFPFFIDAVQLRNFLIMSILTFSFPLLLNNSFFDKIIFVLIMLLASTIQQVAVIYIPLVGIYYIIHSDRVKRIFTKIITVVMAFELTVGWLPPIVSGLALRVNNLIGSSIDDLSHYLVINTRWGGLLYWVNIFLNIIILKLCLSYSEKMEGKYSLKKINTRYALSYLSVFILWMNLVYVFMLPFINVNVDFYRVYRNFFVLDYIVYTNTIFTYGRKANKRDKPIWITFLVFVNSCITFIWQFILSGQFDLIIKNVMNNNWII